MPGAPLSVFLLRRLANGGMERVAIEHAAAAAAAGFRVRLMTLEDAGPLAGAARARGLEVVALGLPAAPLPALVAGLPRLVARFRAERPALVQTHQRRTGFLGRLAALAAGARPVVALHNEDPPPPPGTGALEAWLDRRSAFVGVSRAVLDAAAARRARSPWEAALLPNGLPARAPPRPGPPAPVVGFLGKLEAKKGPDLFLAAAGLLAARVPGLAVRIAGAGPLRDRLRAGAPAGTEWVGEVADGPAYLAGLSLAVFPSRREGFCLAAGEALAAGVPVLLADLPALREVYGALPAPCFVPPGAPPEAWAAAMARLLADRALAQSVVEAGHRALARYPREAATRAATDFYRALLAELGAPAGSAARAAPPGPLRGTRAPGG